MVKKGREAELWEDVTPEVMSEEEDGEGYMSAQALARLALNINNTLVKMKKVKQKVKRTLVIIQKMYTSTLYFYTFSIIFNVTFHLTRLQPWLRSQSMIRNIPVVY